MKSIVLDRIRELEEKIFKGYSFWIFKGYVAVEKRGVEKIIDDIYASLPTHVLRARKYLKVSTGVVCCLPQRAWN